jgi:hypothetical protein
MWWKLLLLLVSTTFAVPITQLDVDSVLVDLIGYHSQITTIPILNVPVETTASFDALYYFDKFTSSLESNEFNMNFFYTTTDLQRPNQTEAICKALISELNLPKDTYKVVRCDWKYIFQQFAFYLRVKWIPPHNTKAKVTPEEVLESIAAMDYFCANNDLPIQPAFYEMIVKPRDVYEIKIWMQTSDYLSYTSQSMTNVYLELLDNYVGPYAEFTLPFKYVGSELGTVAGVDIVFPLAKYVL